MPHLITSTNTNEMRNNTKFIGLKPFINFFSIVLITSIIFAVTPTFSKLNIQVRNITNNPFYTANAFIEIKVTDNKNPLIVTKENILFKEQNFITNAKSVTNLEDNWQKVEWFPNYDRILTDAQDEGLVDYVGTLIISHQGEVVSYDLLKADFNTPKLTIVPNEGSSASLYDLSFGGVAVGDSNVIQVNLRAERLAMTNDDNKDAFPVMVDSITISGDGFYYIWQGDFSSGTLGKKPPFQISGTGYNLMDLVFIPKENKYYNSLLTVHYNGGAKRQLKLFGNNYNFNYQSKFKLLKPNGGEIFAPCERIDIAWTGHTLGRKSFIEISFNGGGRWFEVGSTYDSTFTYQLPNFKGNNVKIRVSQKSEFSKSIALENGVYIDNIDFTSNGGKLAFPKNNNIIEWDISTSSPKKSITYNLFSNPANTYIRDIKYTTYKDINLISLHNSQNRDFGTRSLDTITTFTGTNSSPLSKSVFPDYEIKSFTVLPNSPIVYLVPILSNKLSVFSLQSLNSIQNYIFPIPITSVSVGKNATELFVSFLDGEINIYDLESFNNGILKLIRQIKLPDIPIIKDCLISPNGEYLILSFEYNDKTTFKEINQSILVDANTGQIIRIYKKSFSQTVGFSFSSESNLLVLGHSLDPQVILCDLIKGVEEVLPAEQSTLTKLKFSPQGNALAMTTNGSNGLSVAYQTMNFPQMDMSDEPFTIALPAHKKIVANFGSELIYTTTTKTIKEVLCNLSNSELIFDAVRLQNGTHFKLNKAIVPDTVKIGGCKDLTLNFTPIDTGFVSDTLFLISCENEIPIVLNGYGINRSIKFSQTPFTLAEQCIGEYHYFETDLFTNLDSTSLLITGIKFDKTDNLIFEQIYPKSDTLLPANGKLHVVFRYRIDTLGNFVQNFSVLHNKQSKYIFTNQIQVKGIGTYISLSHKILPFVKEDKKRIITIQNLSLQTVIIDDYIITGSNAFTVTTPKKIQILPNSSQDIELLWNGEDFVEANLFISANPCLVQNNIKLLPYVGESLVTIEKTTSEPTKDGFILLTMENKENSAYRGNRHFEARLNLDSKIFFPEKIESVYNNVSISNHTVIDGRREFTVSATGDFALKGELMKIWGKPGLADKDSTNINIVSQDFFGKSVQSTYRPGNFKVVNICGDRRLLDLKINTIFYYPNPIFDVLNLDVNSENHQVISISLYTTSGTVVYFKQQDLGVGENKISLELTDVAEGPYVLILENNNFYYPINIQKYK